MKNLKLHWLKCPKTVPKKQNLNNKINDSKLNLKFIFEFQIFQQNASKPIKPKEIPHFTIQFCFKNLVHFKNLNSLSIAKNVIPQHSQKPYSLYKFSGKHVSGWFQKNYLYCTISRRPRTAFSKHLESKYLCLPVYFCHPSASSLLAL